MQEVVDMQAVSSPQPRAASIETRRGNEILRVVASAAGVSVGELVNGRGVPGLAPYRNLAMILCRRVYGIEDSRLADVFGISRLSLTTLIGTLLARLERDIPLRQKFDRICATLGEKPIEPRSAWEWPEGRVREIWDRVSTYAGSYTGAELAYMGPGARSRIAPYRWLAIDMCLRLSGMTPNRLERGLGIDSTSARYVRERLPPRLAADEDLRRVDREVSSALGLPPREEWYS
jgi:hypothetical protein